MNVLSYDGVNVHLWVPMCKAIMLHSNSCMAYVLYKKGSSP